MVPRPLKHSVTSILFLALLSTLAAAELKIGSSNTATADPTVPVPKTTACKVILFKGFKFDDFSPRNFTYTPPADCAPPWAKVVLEADFSVTKGIQYDRTANIWIGPTNIYFGTTSEPDPSDGRHWHVERDLTTYSSLFTVPQDGAVDLFNIYNKTYNGLLHGSATLYFYPLPPKQAAPRVADLVIGFSGSSTGGTVALGSPTTLLEQTLTLPTNIENIFFDVFAQGQSTDEFWYSCVPNDIAGELEDCGSTAFRESEVTIDGTPAGVAPVYPWIFTGGIDPFLWIPIPGVQTLNFKPYQVNLTPFAGLLSDGNPHTIALSVFNADNYFSATAVLRLYLDQSATQVSGAVTSNTLTAPNPAIVENLKVTKNGSLIGTVGTKSAHNFEISGYVNTSHGLVTTTVKQEIRFSNLQYFKATDSQFEQNIKQGTKIQSVVTSKTPSTTTVTTVRHDWPLVVDINYVVAPDGSATETTTSNQFFEGSESARRNGIATTFGENRNRVISTDTLNFDSNGNFTGNSGTSSSQRYFAADSTGYCYSRLITSAANVLSSITDGVGCTGN